MQFRGILRAVLVIVFAFAACITMQAATLKARSAATKPAVASMRDVRRVYVSRLQGDRVFARRLIAQMRVMGLRFVRDKARADALLEAQGEYENGAFYGAMKFSDVNGKLLWQARVTRPRGSNYMAYSRLADKLGAALIK